MACNADVFHSSGVQRGPTVVDSEFSYAFDDYCNVHSRVQVSVGVVPAAALKERPSSPSDNAASPPSDTVTATANTTAVTPATPTITLLLADPRLRRDHGLPDDGPYGVVETMPNVRPGMHLRVRSLHPLDATHAAYILHLYTLALIPM